MVRAQSAATFRTCSDAGEPSRLATISDIGRPLLTSVAGPTTITGTSADRNTCSATGVRTDFLRSPGLAFIARQIMERGRNFEASTSAEPRSLLTSTQKSTSAPLIDMARDL